MNSALSGKVALVTGGAGGIGAVISHQLAGAGARVVITYRENRERAEALIAALPGSGHRVSSASVLDSPALGALAAEIASDYGRLDILVNNAGVTRVVPHADLDGLDDATFDHILSTNVRGTFACVRAFQSLLAANHGVVVNISSIAGNTAVGSSIAYCASKAAIDNMTRSLARALAPNIRVLSVAPGWVEGEYASRADPAYLQAQIDRSPLGRIARPDDVAQAVLAACTLLGFTTGAIIPVDGGRPLG
ncbi:MAG: SDR family NAD(P)-dependent oxidoreductase [Gammaproteobacteria bacterium]|nr:SDR family NAD(P)-dependent oxidoreductase [Gammaproteobacteria bacterium]